MTDQAKTIFKSKYRIVADRFGGYECQKMRWWFPVWLQMGYTNTHSSMDAAKKYIEKDCKVYATYVADK